MWTRPVALSYGPIPLNGNIHMSLGHPYGNALWRKRMSTGRRIAWEVRRGIESGRLAELVT